jgi:hypothetical protein
LSNYWKTHLKTFIKDNNEKDLKTQLRKNWLENFPEEKEKIYLFLWKAKLNKLFLYLMSIDIQNQLQDLPWRLFIQIILENKLKLNQEAFDEINEILIKQRILDTKKNKLSELLQALKQKNYNDFQKNLHKKKQELLTSAQIAKSEQLMDQYVQIIEEIKNIYPSELLNVSHITDQEKNKAESIFKKRQRTKNTNYDSSNKNLDELAILNKIEHQSQKLLNEGKAHASDFAFMLRSLGDSKKAIDFILTAQESEYKDWQLLDYYFHAKQYLSVLDHCNVLKNKYSKNPDSLFSIFYIEALSYWELGEREKALDLMGQISTMRPDFKSAAEILSHWKEEPFE